MLAPMTVTHALPPRNLDVAQAAQQGQTLSGHTPLTAFERLAEPEHAADWLASLPPVVWQVRAELRPTVGGADQLWLHLALQASLPQTCQRCLQPMGQPVEVDGWVRLVADEATAEREDEDSEEDVLALAQGRLDVSTLIEDELLLALPLVPMHEVCPEPVRMSAGHVGHVDDGSASAQRPNPFAALAALKGSSKST